MSNNAIINFLFNSQGAVNQLNDFKNKFSNVVSSIEKSGIGTFGALGASLASIFSVKSLVDHAKTINDLHTAYSSMSLEQISLFSNLYELLGGTDKEATDLLKRTKDLIYQLDKGEAPAFLAEMGLQSRDAEGKLKDSVTFLEELREKMKTFSPDQQTRFLEQLGMYSTATKRYMNLHGEERKKYEETAKQMGVVDKKTMERMQEMSFQMGKLRGSFRKLGNTLLEAGVGSLIDVISNAIDRFCQLPEPTQQGIMLIVGGLLVLKPLLNITRNVIALTKALGGLIAAISAPLVGIAFIAFIIAIIFNLFGLRDALDDSLKAFNKWLETFAKDHPIAANLLKQLSDLAEHILHPIEKFEEARRLWNSIWADFEKDHPISSKFFEAFGKMAEMIINPGKAIIDMYNKLADIFGWKKIIEKRPLIGREKHLAEIAENYGKMNADTLGVKGGAVSKEVQEVKSETSIQDNKKYDFNFFANFNSADLRGSAEQAAAMVGSYISRAVNESMKNYAINAGGR